jgi:hypothetical protein
MTIVTLHFSTVTEPGDIEEEVRLVIATYKGSLQ